MNIYYNELTQLYYTDNPEYENVGFLTEEELLDCVENNKWGRIPALCDWEFSQTIIKIYNKKGK